MSDMIPIDSAFPALVDTRSFSSRYALALSLFDKTPLHLSNHPKNGKDELPHFATCCDVWVEHGDIRATLLAFMYDVEHVSCVAAETVQSRDG